jgi:hypothetical protein
MHSSPRLARTLRSTCLIGTVALVSFSASVAEAAPRTFRHAARRHVTHASVAGAHVAVRSCGTSLTLRTLVRQSRTVSGPAVRTPRAGTLQQGLPLPTSLVKRGLTPVFDDGDVAIANDAPAAAAGFDAGAQPALRPLGFLPGSFDRLPPSGARSLQVSRGPPSLT